ncbi:MAG: hypothetical protein COZ49_03760 [Candidatus Yonathbacteria bacterium CG_4_10_14_3_um_filter_47_65]|uniref:ComEC/Rec2-related protein domain-containing protein n=2 Tax=Parcubacteria group TaxID=1794811 RepID=A0A2M8D9U2_9BACT|nr:MAG: hypothetical protein AUJ44_04195 [Candidatus Nomurabacteria bacterium CG1_02_47_685]PIP04226.1 MAG: hypothetical protein COX54_00240 [Candidatus Yonathbacteria bacterium CG23_combo_of_CG06-09_8_20_14_all_46_18]PIQ31618.1 MAG: hypothetical protein COW61_03530 [Candidatus Yonathbacteria bacterium CG17_big_fil_post_rev_8_21_14_2_50_46_19]PIX56123.1 MAG: hypothetical protein COZ49_03760 [Candidatus Yonathbacteria bacterium CG_4_10_14_3_um_filter_47_65]PIY57697.1 MAG: hypothetical protein CO
MRKFFIAGVFCFAGGVLFRSFFDLGNFFTALVFSVGAVIFILGRFSNEKKALLLSVALVSIALGIFRFNIADDSAMYKNFKEEHVRTTAVVVDEPDERETHVNLIVRPIDLDEGAHILGTNVLVVAPLHPVIHYGDIISIDGDLSKPKNFSNQNGDVFDYVSYLAKDDIYFQIFYPRLSIVDRNKGNPVKGFLFSFKKHVMDSISSVVPEPHASLLGGLVFGAKRSLGTELLDKFRTAGVIHIVVLSGYNVTIVADAIMRALSFLPQTFSMMFGGAGIILFAIMTGGNATIVRASVMALLVVIARATGRVYEITVALIVAGFLMILHNPKILAFDASFQLSFLATLGLVYLAPLLERYFHFVPKKFQIREFALSTTATQLFVLPFLLYRIGEISLVALPANILILAFVPLTMFFGFLAGISGFIAPVISLPFAFIAYGLLAYELSVVETFSAIPFASVKVPGVSFFAVVCVYAFYAFMIVRFRRAVQPSS